MNHKLYFTKKNYILFIVAILLLVIGYYFMTIGPHDSFFSLTLAPLILLFAYTVIFPLAILVNFKKNDKNYKE